ncbi:MAG: phospholipase D-like domain-containing protein, partial [Phycisphaeraceae bacterium]
KIRKTLIIATIALLVTGVAGAQEDVENSSEALKIAALEALIAAAKRGVDVTLIVPEQIDSTMARLASRSQYADLLAAGIDVQQFRGGLLHTKTLVADRQYALIGTVNLDMRSLWLNFEITLAVYDRGFAEELRALQERYIEQSVALDQTQWASRPFRTRLIENLVRLLGPLL